jgi:hypothetical protein
MQCQPVNTVEWWHCTSTCYYPDEENSEYVFSLYSHKYENLKYNMDVYFDRSKFTEFLRIRYVTLKYITFK